MLQTKVVEKIKIHILRSITLSPILCRLLNNMARLQMKISDRACDLHAGKLRYQHTQNMKYYCFSTATVVTRTRLNITFTRTLPVFLKFTVTRTVLSSYSAHCRCRTTRILGPQMYFWIEPRNISCLPRSTVTSCGYMSVMVTYR
jgi:hypothetical protein